MSRRLIDLAALGRSPFLADVGRNERRINRLLLGVIAGALAGAVLALMVMVGAGVAFAVQQISQGADVAQVQRAIGRMLDPSAEPTVATTAAVLVVLAVSNAALFGGFVWIASLVQGRRLKASITAAPKIRWRLMWAGLLLFVVVVGPLIALEVVLSDRPVALPLLRLAHTPAERLTYFVAAVGALLLAASVEELLCRGWLMRQTAAWSRNFWVLAIVNGVIFSALHLPDTDPNAFIGRALMGVGFCYMTLRTGGIEFSTGAHAANNILLILFVQTPPLQPAPPEPLSLSSLTTLVALAGYVLITELAVRWAPLRRLTRPDLEPAPAATFQAP